MDVILREPSGSRLLIICHCSDFLPRSRFARYIIGLLAEMRGREGVRVAVFIILPFYFVCGCGCGYPPSCTRSKLERPEVVLLFVLGGVVMTWYGTKIKKKAVTDMDPFLEIPFSLSLNRSAKRQILATVCGAFPSPKFPSLLPFHTIHGTIDHATTNWQPPFWPPFSIQMFQDWEREGGREGGDASACTSAIFGAPNYCRMKIEYAKQKKSCNEINMVDKDDGARLVYIFRPIKLSF